MRTIKGLKYFLITGLIVLIVLCKSISAENFRVQVSDEEVFITLLAVLFVSAEIKSQDEFEKELFKITAYCSCEKCCDKKPSDEWYGITATGKHAKWRTVAVDRKVIKLGSRLKIEGFPNTIFYAEDVGGAIKGRHIDIWFPSHEEALEFGVQKRVVYIIQEE